MTKKFDPAPLDKHAADPKEALKTDFIVDEQLEAGVLGRFVSSIRSLQRHATITLEMR
jgi:hypothetical protein